MDIISHFMMGGLLYLLFLKTITLEYIVTAMFFAALPDLDIFLFPLKRKLKSKYLDHRGGSHSFVMGIIVSFFMGLILSPLLQLPFLNVWIIGALFYGLHIAMDLLTTTKIPFLYPLSKKEVSFYVEKAGSQFTMFSSFLCILTLLNTFNTTQNLYKVLLVINFFTYFFIGYYILRIISKIIANFHLDSKEKYLPGVFPFFYTIYKYDRKDNILDMVLEKKFLFTKRSVFYKKTLTMNSTEMELFEKALSICNSDYYFAKWTLLPAMINTEENISVRFYFLEPMMRKRAVYVQYNFDKISQEVIGVKRYYGPFLD